MDQKKIEASRRLNYYDYQFLQAQDFQAEQKHHIGMRLRENKSLYDSYGVVFGLGVEKAGDNKVKIREGVAIDLYGHIIEIKELEYTLTQGGSGQIYLTVRYETREDDSSGEGGQKKYYDSTNNKYTRQIDQRIIEDKPTQIDDGSEIRLATIQLKDGKIENQNAIDDNHRRKASPHGAVNLHTGGTISGGRLSIGGEYNARGLILNGGEQRLYIKGDVGIEGNLVVTGQYFGDSGGNSKAYSPSGKDVAENYYSDMNLERGDVVCLHPHEDKIVRSEAPNDHLVLGVISTTPRMVLGDTDGTQFPVALCGRVPCKVVDENGPITRGDLLTTAAEPGHAMKATPLYVQGYALFRPGTLIGKALGTLSSGKGVIDVFIFVK